MFQLFGASRKKRALSNSEQIKLMSGRMSDKDLSTIIITSISAVKSSAKIAVALAEAMTLQEKKVLLVECNVKKPAIHRLLHMDFPAGDKQKPLPTFYPLLDVYAVKATNAAPIDFWLSPSFKQQLDAWELQYDVIVFSAPGCSENAETEIIAKGCQKALVVVKRRKDKLAHVKRIKGRFDMAGCSLLGFVYLY